MRPALAAAIVALVAVLAIGAVAFAGARAAGTPSPSASPDRVVLLAPIDDLQVLVRESSPPQVTLKVRAGLPSGCAKQDSYSVNGAGTTINVAVRNTMPAGNPICTMIYGTYELNIDLGSSFAPGTTYTVHVNDKTTTFKT